MKFHGIRIFMSQTKNDQLICLLPDIMR